MNDAIMGWIRPAALIIVLLVVCYMEIFQLKVSEFFIGIATTIVVWFFKSRDDEKAAVAVVAKEVAVAKQELAMAKEEKK